MDSPWKGSGLSADKLGVTPRPENKDPNTAVSTKWTNPSTSSGPTGVSAMCYISHSCLNLWSSSSQLKTLMMHKVLS